MARKYSTSRQVAPGYGDETRGQVRTCDHPDCQDHAEHRAPKSRGEIRDYFWFCLDHVRAYNKAWNYYAGMSEDEVEQELQKDTFWHRPTWRLGERRTTVDLGGVGDPFGVFDDGPNGMGLNGNGVNGGSRGANGGKNHDSDDKRTHDKRDDEAYMGAALNFGARHTQALAIMDLRPPVSMSSLKSRYKELVKRHHPDANGGSRRAEERLKAINIAYGSLIKALEE